MIYVKNTPNSTGVAIYGDFLDFENLYESLHTVVGDEDEHITYDSARLRVLGVCYDIRHALMGDREIEFVDNGMDNEKKMRMSIITSDKNLYLKIYVLWPEILFAILALNSFLQLYAKKKSKKSRNFMLDKQNIWDESIAHVRIFQAAAAKCIKETISKASFNQFMNLMSKDCKWSENYTRQYLDTLNCKFIGMNSEKRLKSIPKIAKRLVERGKEYKQLKAYVSAAAKEYNTYEDNIKPLLDYPEDFEW